ncbi:MAG: hypothetical protein IJ639_05750 [Ruminococcus sp.]|nr:hypothetical protein [Ruminococcus sp.]
MNKITDEQLDARLSAYHEIEPTRFPAFVPSKAAKPSPILPFRNPRMMATAASIVLVVTLGISVYFLFGNKTPIPVASKPTAAATEARSIDATDATFPTEQNTAQSTDSTVNDQVAKSSQVIPTTPATQPMTDSLGNVIPTPTQTNDQPTGAPSPSVTTAPSTELPQDTPTNAPHPSPTQKPVAHPTTAPTVAPITEKPTQAYTPDIRTLRLDLPIIDTATVSEDSDSNLFCCVYDSAGNLLGDSDLYSRSHLVNINSGGYQSEGVVYNYAINYDANKVPDNRFTYKVYLRNGTVVLQGTVKG